MIEQAQIDHRIHIAAFSRQGIESLGLRIVVHHKLYQSPSINMALTWPASAAIR